MYPPEYPPEFYDPIIKTTLDKIIAPQEKNNQSQINDHPKQTLKLQYRGLETDNYKTTQTVRCSYPTSCNSKKVENCASNFKTRNKDAT